MFLTPRKLLFGEKYQKNNRSDQFAQSPEMTPVVSKPTSRSVPLPGEIQPFLNVAVRARVSGYVERVLVDRGSIVKEGELLIELSAPEMKARWSLWLEPNTISCFTGAIPASFQAREPPSTGAHR